MTPRHHASGLLNDEVLCRHWLGLVIIVALTVTLLPAWGLNSGLFPADTVERSGRLAGVFDRLLGQLVSFYLLPAMGFWLALRRRAVDLSVWAVSGLGGVVAAGLINAGLSTPVAFGVAMLAGLGVGALNGYVAAFTRFSSPAFTVLVAAIIVGALGLLVADRSVNVDDAEFGWWQQAAAVSSAIPVSPAEQAKEEDLTAYKIRMLLVACVYSLGMIVLLGWGIFSRRRHWAEHDRAGLFAALAASGALAAAGGAFWLVDQGSAPVPTRMIGDLRVPAAALLAGGALWVGRGRTLLSGLFLPVALLLATAWRQEVTGLTWFRSTGYAVQTALLTGLLLTAHRALLDVLARRGARRAICGLWLILTVIAPATMACQGLASSYAAKHALGLAAVGTWAVALAGLVITRLWPEQHAMMDAQTGADRKGM